MSFKDQKDMYAIIGGFFETVKDSDNTKEVMKNNELDDGYDAIVMFVYHNPEGKVTWVEGENGGLEIIYGDTDRTPEMEFEQTADVGNQFWQGKLDLAQALARQQIQARGPLSKAMRIIPQLEWLYPKYRDYLKEKDREDLLL
ncbi:MAG TPA: hypothetical protein VFK33_12230 [Bacillales bacterium]|nr:hypothetical protein [Bacillales bacterium]